MDWVLTRKIHKNFLRHPAENDLQNNEKQPFVNFNFKFYGSKTRTLNFVNVEVNPDIQVW